MAKTVSTAEAVMIVLAAGLSRRMQGASKLDRRLPEGLTLLERQMRTARAAGFAALAVGRPGDQTAVANPHPERGISESLKIGLAEVRRQFGPASAGVLLADQPFITVADIQRVWNAFQNRPSSVHAVRPLYNGRPGHPVFFDQHWGELVVLLSGDQGIGRMWGSRTDTCELSIDVANRPDPLFDIDTEDAYQQALAWLN